MIRHDSKSTFGIGLACVLFCTSATAQIQSDILTIRAGKIYKPEAQACLDAIESGTFIEVSRQGWRMFMLEGVMYSVDIRATHIDCYAQAFSASK